jgi:hypothetical protein
MIKLPGILFLFGLAVPQQFFLLGHQAVWGMRKEVHL